MLNEHVVIISKYEQTKACLGKSFVVLNCICEFVLAIILLSIVIVEYFVMFRGGTRGSGERRPPSVWQRRGERRDIGGER